MQINKVINAPLNRVWEVLIDTRLWPIWGPSVLVVNCAQRFISAGVRGQLKTAIGLWVEFEITSFQPMSFWGWKVAGIPATGHRLKPLDSTRCELIFELPFVAFPYLLVCRQATNRIARLAEGTGHKNQRASGSVMPNKPGLWRDV